MAKSDFQGMSCLEAWGYKVSQIFAEAGQSDVLKENFGITYKEAGQTTANNTGAYVDLLNKTLYHAAITKIEKILDLVEVNEDLKNGGGFGAMQIPRSIPTIAYEVAEGKVVNYFDEGIEPITVTCKKVIAATTLTWEIKKRGMTGFAKTRLKEAADAVSRKLAGDICNGLAAGTSLSPQSGGITLAKVNLQEAAVNNSQYSNGVPTGFLCDTVVINSGVWGTFKNDDDVKETMYYSGAIQGTPITVAQNPLMIGNMEIVVTPFLTAAQALVLEKKRNLLVKESDLETYEAPIPGRLHDSEVEALMSYVLAIIYPNSMATVTA